MSYKILRITNFYKEYITDYYLKNPDISSQSYDSQYQHLVDNSVEIVTSYSRFLKKLGVDAIDIITNADVLQKQWALENNMNPEIDFHTLVFNQIKKNKPDVVWIDDARLMDKKWLIELRGKVPSLKLLVGHICAPYNSTMCESFTSFDILFTCTPCLQKELSTFGVRTELLYHGFNHSILDTIGSETQNSKKIELIFTGSLYTGFGFHKSRIEFIEAMIRQGVSVKMFGNLESESKVRMKQIMNLSMKALKSINGHYLVDKIPVLKKYKNYGEESISYYSKQLIRSMNTPVFGIEMFKVLSESLICFNIHGEIAKKCAGNLRLFEATGMGTCLVTDWKENIPDLFEPDKEIITYKNKEECIEKISWLLANPEEALKIGKAGQQRTLKNHTIEKRAAYLHTIFDTELSKR